jgi:hypothetical protein
MQLFTSQDRICSVELQGTHIKGHLKETSHHEDEIWLVLCFHSSDCYYTWHKHSLSNLNYTTKYDSKHFSTLEEKLHL